MPERIPLCVTCKGKGLCGKPCPILERVKYWKKTIENVKDFTGTSPPALFVGHNFYPKVFIGILSPPVQTNQAEILDFPEGWYKQGASIDNVLNYRGELIYSRFASRVDQPKGRLVGVTQEIAMSKKPADVEIELKKQPQFRFSFDPWFTPVGNPAPMVKAEVVSNITVENKVDNLVSDHDVKASQAVLELYSHELPVSRIQKIFSAGLLGVKMQRKFVPTRWSITGVDDILGKFLIERVKSYQEIGEIRLFHNEYIGNHYEILLIPGAYQYELIETKLPQSVWNVFGTKPAIYSDYEPFWGRKTYASATGGAFYAGRLGFLEYLESIKRQATVLIAREVSPEYYAPLGIWQMRESVRDAFNKPFERFDSVEQAVKRISERFTVGNKWVAVSKLLRKLKEQRKVTQFT